MIANTLIFLLGILVTALAALILAPIVWRKAQSLARREFEATVPISANEIRAEFDRVRAEAAVSIRRQEVLSAETRTKAARAEADRGRLVVETTQLQTRNGQLERTIEEQDAELAALRTALSGQDAEIQDLTREFGRSRQDGDLVRQELEALGTRLRELTDIAEERKIELVAAEAKIERLSDRIRLSDREDRDDPASVETLTTEISSLQRALRQERAAASVLQDKSAALVGQLAERDETLARLTSNAGSRPADAAGGAAMLPVPATKADERPQTPRARSQWSKPADAKPSGSARVQAALGRREIPALDPAEEADIRERISDVAARVIRMTALAEGPQSPLASLLDASGSPDGPASAGDRPTLAERVRLLAEAERKTAS
jgi:hypothetical protein